MSDFISRQAAIDAMMKLQAEDIEAYGASIPEGFDGDRAVTAIKALPSAQRWIPTSERLPDKSGLYLVTEKTAYGVNLCLRYWNLRQDRSFWSGWGGDNVLAWRPLPEPWKGEQE